jgi:hypothetical protein
MSSFSVYPTRFQPDVSATVGSSIQLDFNQMFRRQLARVGSIRSIGWKESDLRQRAKSDAGKLAVTARLRRETTLPIKRIAARLQLGSSKSANSNLYRWM